MIFFFFWYCNNSKSNPSTSNLKSWTKSSTFNSLLRYFWLFGYSCHSVAKMLSYNKKYKKLSHLLRHKVLLCSWVHMPRYEDILRMASTRSLNFPLESQISWQFFEQCRTQTYILVFEWVIFKWLFFLVLAEWWLGEISTRATCDWVDYYDSRSVTAYGLSQ
jgi:hypothetical protein